MLDCFQSPWRMLAGPCTLSPLRFPCGVLPAPVTLCTIVHALVRCCLCKIIPTLTDVLDLLSAAQFASTNACSVVCRPCHSLQTRHAWPPKEEPSSSSRNMCLACLATGGSAVLRQHGTWWHLLVQARDPLVCPRAWSPEHLSRWPYLISNSRCGCQTRPSALMTSVTWR